jgi:hypothetical protein
MAGYVVQARSTQRASDAQASLAFEAAERDKAEIKAGKQLERVQMQMAEWVKPLSMANLEVTYGWIATARELRLEGYLQMYALEWENQPATPHVEVYGTSASPTMYAAWGRAPFSQLPPEDLALLADPALRTRYCELCVHMLLPGLRRLCDIFVTKSHLNESLSPERLDSVLPGVGRGWKALLGSLSNVFCQMGVHAAQFESLAARWEAEQFDLLQPEWASSHFILAMLNVEMTKVVASKEVST